MPYSYPKPKSSESIVSRILSEDDPEYVLELKVDGNRGRIVFPPNPSKPALLYRKDTDVTANFPPLYCASLADSVLDVEWCAYPRNPDLRPMAEPAATFLSAGGLYKVRKGLIVVLDVPRYNGIGKTGWPFRDQIPIRAVVTGALSYAVWMSWAGRCDVMVPLRQTIHKKETLDQWLAEGQEGAVLKALSGTYENPKWYKIKGTKTVDAWVTGYTEGKGQLAGLAGSLQCYLVQDDESLRYIGSCGGMTRVDRKSIKDTLDAGSEFSAEVRFERWTITGKMRHAGFVRLRDDHAREDCTVSHQAPEIVALS